MVRPHGWQARTGRLAADDQGAWRALAVRVQLRINHLQPNGGQGIEANIAIFRTRYPEFAARIEAAEPVATGIDPDKAKEYAAANPPSETVGCLIFVGAGPHVPAIMRAHPDRTLFLIFEPNPGVWRHLLSDADHADWLVKTNWRLIDDAADEQQVFRALNAAGFVPALGVKVVVTRENDERLGGTIPLFCDTAAAAFRNWRLEMTSALTLPDITQKNALKNLPFYVRSDGIADLELKYQGQPGICVAAGPSLARNIKELKRPHVRESFIIACVQTALKPLLGAGVRPHFVCALDYAPISQRFYEGLTEADCAGIDLVCLSACAPVIPPLWKSEIRFASDGFLDAILGDERASRGQLPPASSVAHMTYNLLRYVGCDPVALVGQDLAYTDGVYYGAGAAIHETWACELNEFNTLEMMETRRCRGAGDSMVWRLDTEGRPVRTDLQLDGYRVRFEQQFAEDVAHGLRVINATEGGQVLQHATPMKLGRYIDRFVGVPAAQEAAV